MNPTTTGPARVQPIMTAKPPTATAPAPAPVTSQEGVDIQKAISSSTSDVALSDLSKKGFKQVKVLNQTSIIKLITEAVDRVIAARAQKIGVEERNRVIQESRAEFERLAKERLQKERGRISELEKANESLLKESEELRGRLLKAEAERDRLKSEHGEGGGPAFQERLTNAILEKLQASGGAGGVKIEESIEKIASRLERLSAVAANVAGVASQEVVIDALFRDDGVPGAESNIDKVSIKEEKAGGVKETLAKLKKLQKGGKDGDK